MRIGILTLPLHTNYGGILQAYALQTVLERMGHEVVVFDTPNKCPLPPFWKLPLCFGKRLLKKILGRPERVFYEYYQNKTRPVIAKNIQPFINTYIHRKIIRRFRELCPKDYDALVVGSDQVWRKKYFSGMWLNQPMENAYLSFAQNWKVRKIAYAASFGTDNREYDDEQTANCKVLIKQFDAVYTREASGVDLCRNKFGVEAKQVLDPTMLLDKSDYIALFKTSKVSKSAGNLLNYVLDESEVLSDLIRRIANQKHLIPFSVNNPYENDESKPLQDRIKPSVETWLRGFYDAEFVVTDSFHACVFSILFKKQFVVVGNKERGMSRFESLLKMFGLEDRLVDEAMDIESLKDIDYDEVYRRYANLREKSMSFLYENLSKEK